MTDRPTTRDDDPEITNDPEATSAADAAWIAELRNVARRTDRPLADVIADHHDAADDAADDEVLPDVLPDDPADDSEHTIDADADAIDVIRDVVRAERAASSAPPTRGVPAVATPPAERSAAKWEPPPRLAGAASTSLPAVGSDAPGRRHVPIGIVIAAVVLAVVLGFVIAQLLDSDGGEAPGSSTVPASDPAGSTVPVEGATP